MISLLLACVATSKNPPSGSESGVDEVGGDLRSLLVAQSWDRIEAPMGDGAGQYRIIFLQESMYSELDRIRRANPDALILAYQKVGGMREDGDDHPSTGVQVHEANEHWFLHDRAGNRLKYCDYTEVWAANIGDEEYQQQWLENVRTRIVRDGFDGVMMDDVNTFPGHCLGSKGTPLAEYPDDEAYGDAVVEFMAAVGPQLMAEGLAVAPNIAMNPWDDTMRAQTEAMWPYITHHAREYWMRWNDAPNFTGNNWTYTLTLMEDAQKAGVGFSALTFGPSDEDAGQIYGRASFLLAWDGVSDSAWGYLDDAVDPWSANWEGDPGVPLDPRTQVGAGWRRHYTNTIVLVNPDPEQDQYFAEEDVTLEPGTAALIPRELASE